jgi:hypothetical protein
MIHHGGNGSIGLFIQQPQIWFTGVTAMAFFHDNHFLNPLKPI